MENGLSKSVVKDSSASKASLGKIIGIMFMSRTYAHMAHLATPSYAAHVALNGFYDDILELVDGIAESAQGLHGKLDIPFVNVSGNVKDPIKALQTHLSMLEKEGKNCGHPVLEGLFHEVQALYLKTIYLLTELS